jgi:two-component system, OmpR family, KDP operon response regulator KdpE
MSTSTNRVLVVVEESSAHSHLQHTLEPLGFQHEIASTAGAALTALRTGDYDAVLLDLAVPRTENIAVCRQMRSLHCRLPILILSDRESFTHKVEALEAGADVYVVRPIAEREFAARLRAAIRRYRIQVTASPERLIVGDLRLDITRRRVQKPGCEVALTPLEFRALHILMEQAGKPITHASLLATLWGPECTQHREYLRVLICGLRKKLEDDPAQPVYLLTYPHFGYLFRGVWPEEHRAATDRNHSSLAS